jgi:hypothetical protein
MLSLAAMILLAAGQAAPAPAQPKPPAAEESCKDAELSGNQREIVICAQRPNGYRINPDVMQAKREAHNGGAPRRPDNYLYPTCGTVGPAPCFSAGINIIAAALTAAEMAKRLAEGKEIGSMFKTGHELSEYELYLEAKRNREAREAEAAAIAKAKAQKAAPKPSAGP